MNEWASRILQLLLWLVTFIVIFIVCEPLLPTRETNSKSSQSSHGFDIENALLLGFTCFFTLELEVLAAGVFVSGSELFLRLIFFSLATVLPDDFNVSCSNGSFDCADSISGASDKNSTDTNV